MTEQTLEHFDPDCTGEWTLEGERGSGVWRCDRCGNSHPSTPQNDRAADREYAYGVLLRSQARQGRLKDFMDLAPRPPIIEFHKPDGDDAEE